MGDAINGLRHRFVRAYGPFRWFLEGFGYRAITMPWRSIYVLERHFDDPVLRRHELVHIEQIGRHGAWRFSVTYVWFLMRHGYRRNPYEIEAYARERE